MSEAGSRILRSVRNARTAARGEGGELVLHVPEAVDVKAIRDRMRLSQDAFAQRYGFSPGAVRDWEQRRRRPEASARVLLTVIDKAPEAVERALGYTTAAKRTTPAAHALKPAARVSLKTAAGRRDPHGEASTAGVGKRGAASRAPGRAKAAKQRATETA